MSFICLSCKESIRPTRHNEQWWEEGGNCYFNIHPLKVRLLKIVNLSGVKFLWVSVMRFACANTNYTRLYLISSSFLNIVFIIFAYSLLFFIFHQPLFIFMKLSSAHPTTLWSQANNDVCLLINNNFPLCYFDSRN